MSDASRRMATGDRASCPCFETLASLAPQHEVVVFQQVEPHPRVASRERCVSKDGHRRPCKLPSFETPGFAVLCRAPQDEVQGICTDRFHRIDPLGNACWRRVDRDRPLHLLDRIFRASAIAANRTDG